MLLLEHQDFCSAWSKPGASHLAMNRIASCSKRQVGEAMCFGELFGAATSLLHTWHRVLGYGRAWQHRWEQQELAALDDKSLLAEGVKLLLAVSAVQAQAADGAPAAHPTGYYGLPAEDVLQPMRGEVRCYARCPRAWRTSPGGWKWTSAGWCRRM